MQAELNREKCIPCSLDTPPLRGDILYELLDRLHPQWLLVEEEHLERQFKFKDFLEALNFVNRVGALAEEEGHHPDIQLSWGKVIIKLMTYKIKGLSRNDFVLASKIDQLL
ncbi:MAG: 4a-hydroxytetrahydrobiopterin dehydratase [Clostridia bacterium]|nr:4a-hydroxytetrahydrobiopterin dehydratase [Clostridia bacterium]